MKTTQVMEELIVVPNEKGMRGCFAIKLLMLYSPAVLKEVWREFEFTNMWK